MAGNDPRRSRLLALFKVGLLSFSVLFSLVFAELAVRVVAPQPKSWLAIYQRDPARPVYDMLPSKDLHVDTGETQWDILTDENGFRFDPELRESKDCKLLWLGDSYAFGHGVDYAESFVGLVDERLPEIETTNAAVSGYGPTQYRQQLEHVIEQGRTFDFLVVATYVGNDFHDTKWEKNLVVADGILGNENDLKSLLMRNLHLYRLGASVYHRFSPRREAPYRKIIEQLARPDAWQEPFLADARSIYQQEMGRILELGRQQGAEVRFVILPTRHAVASEHRGESPEAERGEARPMLPIENAAQIFETLGGRYVDVTPAIAESSPSEMFFQFDGHFTQAGSIRAADAILDAFAIECAESTDG